MTKIFRVRENKDALTIQHQLILVIQRYFKGNCDLELRIYEDIVNQKMILRIKTKQSKPYEGTYLNPVGAKSSKESV